MSTEKNRLKTSNMTVYCTAMYFDVDTKINILKRTSIPENHDFRSYFSSS